MRTDGGYGLAGSRVMVDYRPLLAISLHFTREIPVKTSSQTLRKALSD
jgi:hypothetical protein